MNVYAISDLHLSTTVEKPMDIFGEGWQDYFNKISNDWQKKVCADDIVLLGGDISWGLNIEEAKADFELISKLPGKKFVTKGNHDYYWNSLNKMQSAFPEFNFIQNNCYKEENVLICGTRGWNIANENTNEQDAKIYSRELIRLELSLSTMQRKREDGDIVVALLHYPPFEANYTDTEVTKILEKYKVDKVVYGHLHGKNARVTPKLEKNGIEYFLTSCDLVDNTLIQII